MTRSEYEEAIATTCPHCRAGNEPRFRKETSEWVHDLVKGTSFSHTLCLATDLRNSRFAEEAK